MEDRFAHLYAERARGAQPSAIREICKLIDRPQMKSLAGGWPDPAVFPAREVAEISAAILDTQADKALQYGTTEGFIELRQALAEWSRKEEGIDCHPDDLLILHGSQQGVDLAVRVFVEPGDVVLVGLPTYFGGTGAVTGCDGTLQGVPVDEDGLDVEALGATAQRLARAGRRVKGVYVITNFQNPTGATLPAARRRRLLELAETHDFMIFEDDPYGDLRFEGEKPPSLKALDTQGRVVHVRSLSKTFAPGLRLAWLIGERAAVRKMAIAKQFVDSCTNSLVQLIFLEFLRRGLWQRAIERNIAHYRRKRDVDARAAGAPLPAASALEPAGRRFLSLRASAGTAGRHRTAGRGGRPAGGLRGRRRLFHRRQRPQHAAAFLLPGHRGGHRSRRARAGRVDPPTSKWSWS